MVDNRNETSYASAEIPMLLELRRGVRKNAATVRNHIFRGRLVADFIDMAGHARFYESTVLAWFDGIKGRGRPKRKRTRGRPPLKRA